MPDPDDPLRAAGTAGLKSPYLAVTPGGPAVYAVNYAPGTRACLYDADPDVYPVLVNDV